MKSDPLSIYTAATKFVHHSSSLSVGEWHYFGIGDYFSELEAEKVLIRVFGGADFYVILSEHEVEYTSVIHAVKTLQEKLITSDIIISNKAFNKAIVFNQNGNYQIHPTISLSDFIG
jgi:hypothetical protein